MADNGLSLAPFTDGKNMVLFPQFKANDYTVVLEYLDSNEVGERQFTVAYGASLPQLPKNLTGEHKTFSGWYRRSIRRNILITPHKYRAYNAQYK